jgi:A/G-specific adenine glycosylase
LPWRDPRVRRDPYAVWVSETMLQQTRVQTVIPYWERFVAALPTVRALAEAPESQVLSLWSGLGYYRRARMLHAAARRVVSEHGGSMPTDVEVLRGLEGVGAYTAGAVASIAFGKRAAAVDGNVARVLARLFAVTEDVSAGEGRAKIWRLAEGLVPRPEEGDPGSWNEALMELGATVCMPRNPACGECPVGALCLARKRGTAADLPRKAAKNPPREVARDALVLRSGTRVLLARRKSGGLFGGLWEVPTGDAGAGALAAALGIPPATMSMVGEVVHVLSHRRMHIAVSRAVVRARKTWPVPGDEYEAVDWVTTGAGGTIEDARPHATLTRKILAIAVVGGARGVRP